VCAAPADESAGVIADQTIARFIDFSFCIGRDGVISILIAVVLDVEVYEGCFRDFSALRITSPAMARAILRRFQALPKSLLSTCLFPDKP
jgi:hypothetical protein